jgi:hypothetical protein
VVSQLLEAGERRRKLPVAVGGRLLGSRMHQPLLADQHRLHVQIGLGLRLADQHLDGIEAALPKQRLGQRQRHSPAADTTRRQERE